MIIDQLPTISTVVGTDEIPIEKGQLTYKATVTKIITDAGIATITETGDVSTLSGFTATDLTGAANELKTDISGIHGLPSGGSTGEFLKKASGTNYDVEWGSPTTATTSTTVATNVTAYINGDICIIHCAYADFHTDGYLTLPSGITASTANFYVGTGVYTGGTGVLMVNGNTIMFQNASGTLIKSAGVYGSVVYVIE